jgi:hypothetical protein
MIISEMLRIAFQSIARMTSNRVDEDVFNKLYLHTQSRLGVGVICGVLITLPVLDITLELWHHFLYLSEVTAAVALWCSYFETRVLDEATTIRMASALKDDGPIVSVF